VRSRLAVRPETCRLAGRTRCVLEYCLAELCERRMVHDARSIGATLDENLCQLRIQHAGALRGDGAEYRQTRQLVSEADRVGLHVEQPAGARFVDCHLPWPERRFDQPRLRAARTDRDQLGQLARAAGAAQQPCHHRITHAAGHELTRAGELPRGKNGLPPVI
jgi:hypothetical protein